MNFQMFKLVLEKAEEPEIANICWIIKKAREFQKNIYFCFIANICWIIKIAREFQKNVYFCFIDYTKAFDSVDHNKLENSERDGNTRPPDLALKKPVCRSESNRTWHGTTDWFPIGKGVCQGYVLSPCLFNLYAEYIMRNDGLEEAQARIKIAGRNINNLSYAGDTTLMAESVKRN